MKSLRLLIAILFIGTIFSSCSSVQHESFDNTPILPSLESIVSGYDLWYVDYHRTIGNGEIPFVDKAFTLSFINGVLYANNNIVDIGRTGNGLGIDVGIYNTDRGVLETNHDLDGAHDFEVSVISENEIEIYNYRQNTTYFLIGYQVSQFDYDKLFYENIEYFLQEYMAWEKVATLGGVPNPFDVENYLQFTPENNTTFYSSQDNSGTPIDRLDWSYVGDYEVFDVAGYEDLKIVTLYYDGGDVEEFELSIINDGKISMFNTASETIYEFIGRGFLQFLRGENIEIKAKDIVRNSDRKRTKVERKIKTRRNLK